MRNETTINALYGGCMRDHFIQADIRIIPGEAAYGMRGSWECSSAGYGAEVEEIIGLRLMYKNKTREINLSKLSKDTLKHVERVIESELERI